MTGLWLVLCVMLLCLLQYLSTRYYRLVSAIPAAKAPRFIGHMLTFFKHTDRLLEIMTNIFTDPENPKNVIAVWAGPKVFVYLRSLTDIEKLLTSTTLLKKSDNYDFLQPWLGEGLINAYGSTWQFHRKMITPSFHFKILEGFLDIMLSKLEILGKILDEKVDKGFFDIEPYIANYSLDVIAETALSTNIDAQKTRPKVVDCIKSLTEVIIARSVRLYLFFDIIFYFSPYYSIQTQASNYVNNFIQEIIVKKRKESKSSVEQNIEDFETGMKKKLALLDMLFQVQAENPRLTDKEIMDEVNTFMFAGHDTTTSGISFTLYLLSQHQDVQEKVYKELKENLEDSHLSYQKLVGLKYLERVIKESLRLYPSVPYIGRRTIHEMGLQCGHTIPADCNTAIFIYNHHRNPDNFPEPEKFDPDRFLPENAAGRHPFAYIPFSSGSRNCIGQKFAMLEIMVTVSRLVGCYRVLPEAGFLVKPISHIVLRPKNGVRVRLETRQPALFLK